MTMPHIYNCKIIFKKKHLGKLYYLISGCSLQSLRYEDTYIGERIDIDIDHQNGVP